MGTIRGYLFVHDMGLGVGGQKEFRVWLRVFDELCVNQPIIECHIYCRAVPHALGISLTHVGTQQRRSLVSPGTLTRALTPYYYYY